MATTEKKSWLDQSPVEGRVPGPWESAARGHQPGRKKPAEPKGGSRVPPPTQGQVRKKS